MQTIGSYYFAKLTYGTGCHGMLGWPDLVGLGVADNSMCHVCVPPAGRPLVHESVPETEATGPVFAVLFSSLLHLFVFQEAEWDLTATATEAPAHLS